MIVWRLCLVLLLISILTLLAPTSVAFFILGAAIALIILPLMDAIEKVYNVRRLPRRAIVVGMGKKHARYVLKHPVLSVLRVWWSLFWNSTV